MMRGEPGEVRREPIRSDALITAGYDPETRRLAVEYEAGGVYEYDDVDPELYDELLAAQPHPWSVVGERVKQHRYRQIR